MAIFSIDNFERKFDQAIREHNLQVDMAYVSEIQLASIWNVAIKALKLLPYVTFMLGLLKISDLVYVNINAWNLICSSSSINL